MKNMHMKEKSVTVLYHKDCHDGFGAAWAAHMRYPEASFIPVSYNDPMPDLVSPDGGGPKLVYILDFSFPQEQMLELHNRFGAGNVILLDHHETAATELAGLPNCHVSQEHSGAIMTWNHLFPQFEAPTILKYVEDRDLWKWELPQSREVSAYIASWFNDRTFIRWKILSREIDYEFNEVAISGSAILRTHQQLVEQACAYAHTVVIDGLEVPAVESGVLQSEIGEHLLQKFPGAPFAAIYVQEERRTRWSLRARDGRHNLANTAARFQGGGHASAAGFSIRKPRRAMCLSPDTA